MEEYLALSAREWWPNYLVKAEAVPKARRPNKHAVTNIQMALKFTKSLQMHELVPQYSTVTL